MRTFIFGYGSLIASDGINGRGMERTYKQSDLLPAHLSGYRRTWSCAHQGELYLGLTPVPGIRETPINGVLFPISERDMLPFLKSEGNSHTDTGSYRVVDVTGMSPYFRTPEAQVLTLVTRNPSQDGVVSCRYQHIIRRGLELWGPDFQRQFMETTDWSTFRYETRRSGGHDYHYVISEWYDMLVK